MFNKKVLKVKNDYLSHFKTKDVILLSAELYNKSFFIGFTQLKDIQNNVLQLFGVKFLRNPQLNSKFIFNENEDFLEISRQEFNSIIHKDNVIASYPLYLLTVKIDNIIKRSEIVADFLSKKFKCNSNEVLNHFLYNYDIENNQNFNLPFLNGNNYFIQKISPENQIILKNKMFISEWDNDSANIRRVHPGDIIIFVDEDMCDIVSIAKVRYNLFNSFKDFRYFHPENTIRFDNIEYISKSLFNIELTEEYMELKEIEVKSFINDFHMENLSEFILKTCETLFFIIKMDISAKLFPIKEFIDILEKILITYGFNISYQELESFFSFNAHKLNFKYTPSHGELNVKLYDKKGRKYVLRSHLIMDR